MTVEDVEHGTDPAATYPLVCRNCAALTDVGGETDTFHCGVCGAHHGILRCLQCNRANVLSGPGRALPAQWTCAWCSSKHTTVGLLGKLRKPDTAANAWAELNYHGLTDGDQAAQTLGGFIMIAGHGSRPPNQAMCSITALRNEICVVAERGTDTRLTIPYTDLLDIQVSGRGVIPDIKYKGNISTWGSVNIRAAETRRSRLRPTIETFLRITTRNSEMQLQHPHCTPDTVRNTLGRIFVTHMTQTASGPTVVVKQTPPPAAPSPATPLDELERLTKLHAAGALTDTEFERARARQIKRLDTES